MLLLSINTFVAHITALPTDMSKQIIITAEEFGYTSITTQDINIVIVIINKDFSQITTILSFLGFSLLIISYILQEDSKFQANVRAPFHQSEQLRLI